MDNTREQTGSDTAMGKSGSAEPATLFQPYSRTAEDLSGFFGSSAFAAVIKPGRRRDKFLAESRCRVYPVGTVRQRSNGKGPTKTGQSAMLNISHEDAIAALRCSMVSPPEVKTEELMSEYRALKNKMKRLRKLLAA